MTDEQTPAAGPLTAESVALLKKGDWLRAIDTTCNFCAGEVLTFEGLGPLNECMVNGMSWMASRFTFLGRPDQDGWIAHDGEVKGPVDGSGILCDFIMSDGREYLAQKHPRFWHLVSKWRPHLPSPASSSSVVQGDAGGVEREPITHEVKCWSKPFAAVKSGAKPWELRINDRDYRTGDTLIQREWSPDAKGYTGEQTAHRIGWMLHGPAFGLPDGYVIMTLEAALQEAGEVG